MSTSYERGSVRTSPPVLGRDRVQKVPVNLSPRLLTQDPGPEDPKILTRRDIPRVPWGVWPGTTSRGPRKRLSTSTLHVSHYPTLTRGGRLKGGSLTGKRRRAQKSHTYVLYLRLGNFKQMGHTQDVTYGFVILPCITSPPVSVSGPDC